jgi:hypothetical protein
MGSTIEPSYANLYVGLFEERLVNNESENPLLNKVLKWYRYILTTFFSIWGGMGEGLSDFTALLNDIDPNLKFTIECDTHYFYVG